jgi:hypothetical protein
VRRRAEHFELTLVLFIAGLTFLFQTIFGSLFYSALLKFLGKHFGVLESDVIAKFSELFVPLVHICDGRNQPQLTLTYAMDKTVTHRSQSRQIFLRATNPIQRDISGAQVKIEESKFKKEGSSTWQPTSIIARPNMSWASLPDGDPQKYSTHQLAPGDELIDFLTGPPITVRDDDGLHSISGVFLVQIDPKQGGVNPIFSEEGQYKFVMQISALDAEPYRLTLLVDWDGKDFVIRSEAGQVLEPARSS